MSLRDEIDSILAETVSGYNYASNEEKQAILNNKADKLLATISKHLPENVLEEPRLFQGSGGDSAPFFCSLCGMGEMQIMGRKEDDRYYCHCSYWSDPHNAYLDKSGGRWLGWFDKDAAQKIIDGLPTISVDEVNKLLTTNKKGKV